MERQGAASTTSRNEGLLRRPQVFVLRAAALMVFLTLLLASQVIAGSFGTLAPSDANRVLSMGALSASQVWLLTEQRLLWSNDGGAAWKEDAYIASPETRLQAAQFLDSSRGWIVVTGATGTGVVRTSNSSLTWELSSAVAVPGGEAPTGASLSFVNETIGYLMLRLPSSSNFSRGALFRTEDGGRTWMMLPTPPIGDAIRFVSAQNGWLAGGPAGSDLFRTRDGGRSWKAVKVAPTQTVGVRQVYHLPAFDNDEEGLLPVLAGLQDTSSITLYETHDGGDTWKAVGSVDYNLPGLRPLDLHDHTLITTDRGGVFVTLEREDGGVGKVRRGQSSGLPSGFDVGILSFADSSRGWVTANASHCSGFKTGCWNETRILRTRDVGANMEDVTPELLRKINHAAEEAREPGPMASSEWSMLSLIAGGTQLQQNRQGFDSACYPSVSSMQNWWVNSPYYYAAATSVAFMPIVQTMGRTVPVRLPVGSRRQDLRAGALSRSGSELRKTLGI